MTYLTESRFWYLIYTVPKVERKISEEFLRRDIPYYWPTHTVVRQWSDRRKKLVVPLFPNYMFVSLPVRRRKQVFSVSGVLKFVSIDGEPCIVDEHVINTIKFLSDRNPELSNEMFLPGDLVTVIKGPLCGLSGLLVERKGKHKLAVSFDILNRSLLVEVFAGDVERKGNYQVAF